MFKKSMIFAVLAVWIIGLAGCALLTRRQQIKALKSLGDEQASLEKFVIQQEEFFLKLRSDIQNQGLVKGTPKSEILSLYGEPLYCEGSGSPEEAQETCVYRHPTRSFSSDLISLSFDQDQNLLSWEVKSCH